jgi:heme-degrading monooxygenase HmoA
MEAIMFAVAFEVLPSETGYQQYLDIAAALKPKLETMDGFLSIERFRSVTNPGWILSLSWWRDEAALVRWRAHGDHHAAQVQGRRSVFSDYRLRVAQTIADNHSTQPRRPLTQRPLVGFWEYPKMHEVQSGKLYESLVHTDKRIALFDFADQASALAWHSASITKTPHALVRCCAVERDYGMFERAQAPQHFD